MRLITLILLATAILPAQKRPVTHEDIYLLKRTGEPIPSPDGKWVISSLTEPAYDPAQVQSDLWIVPVDGATPARRLTASRGPESGVAWSPASTRTASRAPSTARLAEVSKCRGCPGEKKKSSAQLGSTRIAPLSALAPLALKGVHRLTEVGAPVSSQWQAENAWSLWLTPKFAPT